MYGRVPVLCMLQTRVLSINSVNYLPKMDLIIVLRNGEVSEIGTYNELLNHKGPFSEFIGTYLLPDSDTSDPEGSYVG